jgi:hypothetical protein
LPVVFLPLNTNLFSMHKYFNSKFLILLVLSVPLFSGCYTSYNVVSQSHSYDNNINFTIEKVEEGTRISTGNGYYYTKSGFKYVFLHMSIKNNSSEKQKLDFNNFYLLEPKSHTKYKVEFAMFDGPFVIMGRLASQIQKDDTKNRILVFTFPEKERAVMLYVNDVIYNIQYDAVKN